tara:strand:- start:1021 stop:1251 length:231 start_codon:yes stop_codon:yes gene_type:complete
MIEQAQTMIINLKSLYHADRFHFDFNIAMNIAGPSKKTLRQNIAYIITGQKIPHSKCGIYAICDMLKAHYEQPSLF